MSRIFGLNWHVDESSFIVRYRRHIAITLFCLLIIPDFLFFSFLPNVYLIHPITHIHYFASIVFLSILVSWKIRDLKSEGQWLQHSISLYFPQMHRYDEKIESESQRTHERLDEIFKDRDDNDDVEYRREKSKIGRREKGVKKNLENFEDLIDDCIVKLRWIYIVESVLYFFNLSIGGYIALCVSTALIEK